MSGQHDNHDLTADAFAQSRAGFEQLVDFAGGQATGDLEHAALEEELEGRGRELLRQLLQDHLDLRAARESRLAVVTDAAGTAHRIVEAGHDRVLATVFGEVRVRRLAYRARGAQPAPGRRRVEPAGREALPRAASPGCDRGGPRFLR